MRKLVRRSVESLRRGHRFVTRDIWRIGLPGEEICYGFIIKQIRVAILLIRGITEETLLLRASALTFATLLFIVPFTVFMFYFIQTFNLGDEVYRRIWNQVDGQFARVIQVVRGDEEARPEQTAQGLDAAEPIPDVIAQVAKTPSTEAQAAPPAEGAKARTDGHNEELQEKILSTLFPILSSEAGFEGGRMGRNPIEFLFTLAHERATNPETVGIAGVLFVLSTVFGFMRNIESAFNGIWGVKRTGNPFRRLSDYMMITLLVPFVAAGALGLNAALESEYVIAVLGPFAAGIRGGQLAIVCLTFSLLYFFVPNTKVRLRYALLGGIVAGLLWVLTSWAFVRLQYGLARYALFFSTFALFPFLLMWIYFSWVILLFGALIAYAYQNETTFAMEQLANEASYAYREAVAVRAMVEMARRFKRGRPGLALVRAAEAWKVPTRLLSETLDCLVEARLVSACKTDPVTYQPAHAPERVKVRDIVRAVREAGCDPSALRNEAEQQLLFRALDRADAGCLSTSIGELAEQLPTGDT